MLGYILIIIGIILAIVLGVFVHAGFFYTLRIRTSVPASMPHRVAYKLHRGPYKNAGVGFRDVEKIAPSLTKFGIYYDDPAKVASSQLRYIVGCCLSDNAEPGIEDDLSSNGYSIWTFPKCSNAIITEFPYRSVLSLFVAPYCVYPALSRYTKKKNLELADPIIEVYNKDCIRYFAPLGENEGYFVPEVAMETETKKEQ